MLLFVWHQTPPTPSPHYHQCDRRKLFWIFRCPVGQGYKNTNLATLHFESPLNCVFTPVIILGGSRPVPVGFVEQWRWCARRRCLNTDRKRTHGLFATRALVAHQLFCWYSDSSALSCWPPSFHRRLPLSCQLNSFDTNPGYVRDESINKLWVGNHAKSKIIIDVLTSHCLYSALGQ